MLRSTIFLLKLKDCPLIILHKAFRIVKLAAYGFVVVVALQAVLQEILRHAHLSSKALRPSERFSDGL